MTAWLASDWVFALLFVFAVLDGFFPPLPSETAVIALATTWVAGQGPNVVLVVLVAAGGAFTGDQLAYVLGRRVAGRRAARRQSGEQGRRATVGRVQELLGSRGGPALLGARFVPGGRTALNLAAGALRFPRRQFVAWTGFGTLLWATYYAVIGSVTGAWLRGNALAAIVVGVACGAAIGWLVDLVMSRRARTRSAAVLEQGEAALDPSRGSSGPATRGSPHDAVRPRGQGES